MTATLHFVHDPLCGWCYGAEPLVNAAAGVEHLGLRLRGGGLWPEPTRLPEETRRYIRQADARVAAISGQPYGDAYLDGLLQDPTMTLESRPTTAAVLAAESFDPAKGLEMLRGIQHGHYERGLRVVEPEVLEQIAVECGLDAAMFRLAMGYVDPAWHFDDTRQFMRQIGASGFPAFVLQIDDALYAVPHHQFASDPDGFASWLEATIEKTENAMS